MPIFAYADPIHFRRWYPNIKQLGLGRTSGKGYWGAPGSDVKGNRGGGSYSRHGTEGKGLGDIAQHTYNAIARSKLTSGVDRAIFDRMAMTFRTGGTDVFKGMYQLAGSPKYAGGAFTEDITPEAMAAYRTKIKLADRRAKHGSTVHGAITTGHGKGYPSWVIEMLNKANTTEDQKAPSPVPLGLGLLVLKVLL